MSGAEETTHSRGLACFRKTSETPDELSTRFVAVEASNPLNDGSWQECCFTNAQGLKLHGYHVAPSSSCAGSQTPGPRGIVVMVHGIKAHAMFEFNNADKSGRHCVFQGSIAEKLSSMGFHVFCYDQQSHGLSEGLSGKRVYVNEFDDVAKDLLQFAGLARALVSETLGCGSVPMFALGESMGGGVVCGAALLDPSAFTGLVLLAPMLSVENLAKSRMNRIMRPIGNFLSTVAPRAKLVYIPPPQKFPEMHEHFQADPLVDHSKFIRTRTAITMATFCERAIHRCAEIQTPFVTMHSQDDTLVDPDSSAVLMRDSPSTDKEFVHLDHMWHAFLHEPGSEEVVKKIAEWIDKRA